jgi:hypothetical protein
MVIVLLMLMQKIMMRRTMMSRVSIDPSVLTYLIPYSFSEREVTMLKKTLMKGKHFCIPFFCPVAMLTLSPISDTVEL